MTIQKRTCQRTSKKLLLSLGCKIECFEKGGMDLKAQHNLRMNSTTLEGFLGFEIRLNWGLV